MIDGNASYEKIQQLLEGVRVLLRQQLDSIKNDRGMEPYMECNERAHLIRELIGDAYFLKRVRADTVAKHQGEPIHPMFMEQRDRILDELSVLIRVQAHRIEDLGNPYRWEKYNQRKQQIYALFEALEASKAESQPSSQTKRE
jgi:hypothetical protein